MVKHSDSKTYIRDGRSPIPSKISTSRVMSSNSPKHTGPELALRKYLYSKGIRGYRLHSRQIVGRPDIAFINRKLAIFVNGCFWHRCPKCKLPLPKSNKDFWKNKFKNNIQRDNKNNTLLLKEGWNVVIIWECQIKDDLPKVAKKIKQHLSTI